MLIFYWLRQRVSLAAQRGNVASILGTLPPGKELEEVYYLLSAPSLLPLFSDLICDLSAFFKKFRDLFCATAA